MDQQACCFATPWSIRATSAERCTEVTDRHACKRFSRVRPARNVSYKAVCMTSNYATAPAVLSPALDISGQELPETDAYKSFVQFFVEQSGSWNSQRTYHYLLDGGREDSVTTFDVSRLTSEQVSEVLAVNGDAALYNDVTRNKAQGFQVSFLTQMASQDELVRSSTNLAFIPTSVVGGIVRGKYYRLLGYEESAPQKADFNFDAGKKQLNMITYYTRVVSVDEITLSNPVTRIRKIINFVRPPQGQPLTRPILVGFGVETKCSTPAEKIVT